MRTLTLIRHAEAAFVFGNDFARPLTDAGIQEVAQVAAQVLPTLPKPDALICSPALRTQTTARMLAQVWWGADGDDAIQYQPRIYEATLNTLFDLLRDSDPQVQHLVLIGHNPAISELAYTLSTASGFCALPTCGVAHFRLNDGVEWHDVGEDCAVRVSL